MAHTDLYDIATYLKTKVQALNDVYGNDLVKEVTLDQASHEVGYPAVEVIFRGINNSVLTNTENRREFNYTLRVVVQRPKGDEEAALEKILKIGGEILDALDDDPYLLDDTPQVADVILVRPSIGQPAYQERETGQVQILDISVVVIKKYTIN